MSTHNFEAATIAAWLPTLMAASPSRIALFTLLPGFMAPDVATFSDEGVPMNFVEIGKWAWSPTRKNATLTVQVYRNDEDPDQGGKYEVKPGEKFEITPDFG